MSIRPLHLRKVLAELRRRKVVRAVAAYSVCAFFIVEVVDRIGRVVVLPPGTEDFTVVVALIGLPFAVVLSWLYEVVPDRGPPDDAQAEADTVSAAADAVHAWPGLPSYTTEFMGRAAELRTLEGLLGDPHVRLVTILAPGGAGKTRLAVRAAELAASGFRDGVAYVPLSSLPARELLPQALAQGLGVSLSRREGPMQELLDFLRPKELLLLLDNFDELTGEAGVLATILEHAPAVRLLVTTRERLNLMEETLLTLEGLDSEGAGSDAVQLFTAAARRHDHQFEADPVLVPCIERICALVVGMPLALELAAAWVRVLSCTEICAELEHGIDILSSTAPGIPERHRSMRAVFDASWRLLSADEARAAARLAVLQSDFDRQTAARVAGADAPVVRMLLDKSLLSRVDGRFVMLIVVRQYALERLATDAAEERETRQRHMRHFAELLGVHEHAAVRWEPHALGLIAHAIDEVRAAWTFAVQSRDAPALVAMVDPLFHFYDARGWVREGLEAFGRAAVVLDAASALDAGPALETGPALDAAPALEAAPALDARPADAGETGARPAGAQPDPRARSVLAARLDIRRGVLHSRVGELDVAEVLLERGVAAAREQGDTAEVVFALNRMGANWLLAGKYVQAESAHHEARDLAEATRDSHGTGWSLTHLGNLAWVRGEYETASRYYSAALDILREQNDRNGMWTCVNNLGVIAYAQKNHEEGRRRFREGLTLQHELRNRRSTAMLLHNLGCAEVQAGHYAEAREHLRQALATGEQMGYRRMCALSLVALADLSLHEGAHDAAATDLRRALHIAAAARNQPVSLEALVGIAQLRHRRGDTAGAIQLARVVALHPASEEDARAKARQLLDATEPAASAEVNGDRPKPGDVNEAATDLDELIASLLESETAPISV